MDVNINYLNNNKICVVYCRQENDDINSNKLEISTLHGIAKVLNNTLYVQVGSGNPIVMPKSAYRNIFPNDGTEMLKDADFFMLVKVKGKLQ